MSGFHSLIINGKVNKHALPSAKSGALSSEYIAPANEFEEKLAQIWANILGIEKEKISTRQNFFEIGGTSLHLIRQVSLIYKEFGIEVTVDQIYHSPTIEEIAKSIQTNKYVNTPVVLLNKPAQKKFFCFPPVVGFSIAYQALANILKDYSLYSFNFIEDENRLHKYIEIITHIQPVGPYILLGWSAAGKLVFEIAGMLEQQNHEVSDIIIVDSFIEYSRINEEKLIEQNQKFLLYAQEYLEREGLGFVKEKVRKKMEQYLNYYNRDTKVFQVIHANVHLIKSESTQTNSNLDITCWDKFTTNPVLFYNGFGRHELMLNEEGPLEKNAEIIKKILDRIIS